MVFMAMNIQEIGRVYKKERLITTALFMEISLKNV